YVSRKVPSKFIKVDKNEVLLALKNVTHEKGLKIIGSKGPLIKTIMLEGLEGNVVAVLINGNRNFDVAKAEYNEKKSCFVISLEKPTLKSDAKVAVKQSVKDSSKQKEYKLIKPKVTKIKQDVVEKDIKEQDIAKKPQKIQKKTDSSKKGYNPPRKQKSIYSGDISDLLLEVNLSGCNPNKKPGQLDKALSLLKQAKYEVAMALLEKHLTETPKICGQEASYLKAYAY
ncbi:MAG: hypothetical protein GY697_26510, partial [Desulfobacterales bacterium]|nr:hypothetical protein [Desulfobacterales bacterium]